MGNSTPQSLFHHYALATTFRLMFFMLHIHKSWQKMTLSLKALATGCGSIHFPHKFAFIQYYFSRFILFGHSCVLCCVCISACQLVQASEAMLHCLYGLRLKLNGNREKKEKRSTSARFTPSIMTAPSLPHHSFLPRSHFYSHTSQPMSSHLHSPACKLYRSVSTNDAYQQ